MSISGISSSANTYQTNQTNPFAKAKEDLNNLGKAITSGNISDAKAAFAQLQKDAPAKSGSSSDPMSSDIQSLGKALASGDIKTAQEVYSKIQDKMSQGPPAGGQPAGGGGGANKTSGAGSDSSKVYDKKDTNKDGIVSSQEEILYAMTHLEAKTATQDTPDSTSSANSVSGGLINTMA